MTEYRKQLKTLNIQDYQVRTLDHSYMLLIVNFFYSLTRMIFSLIFALPGIIMLIPLGMVIAYFAEKERRKALAGSNVKVRAVDVMASVKVAATLVLYPIYCFLFTFAFLLFCRNKLEFSKTRCFQACFVFLIFFPVFSIRKKPHR
jgi:glycerol-3-phosphate O-acyltransferase/dihydroxyacetone phosphate acyltransferase